MIPRPGAARRAAATANRARAIAVVRKAAAVCLSYPDDAFPARLVLVRAVAEGLPPQHADAAKALRGFVELAAPKDPFDLAARYVELFDQRNRSSLYLTWWTAGDTRNRGTEIVRFIEAYREAGWKYGGEELPDHLPVVLDFAACGGEQAAEVGTRLLSEHRQGMEKLHAALQAAARRRRPGQSGGATHDPYPAAFAAVIAALLATIPVPEPGAGTPAAPSPAMLQLLPFEGVRR